MDTPALRLADLNAENAEVVGLNGKLAGHFGYSLPVVRHKPTGLWCVLSVTRKPGPAWKPGESLREAASAGGLTLFEVPIPLPAWDSDAARQPVVAWFPDFFDVSVKERAGYTPVRSLTKAGARAVFFGEQRKVESLFSVAANRLRARFDLHLADPKPDWPLLNKIAETGLQATRDAGQRYWMYVRRCVPLYFDPSSAPELAQQLFVAAVAPSFEGVDWNRFLQHMLLLTERARHLREFGQVTDPRLEKPVVRVLRPGEPPAWGVPAYSPTEDAYRVVLELVLRSIRPSDPEYQEFKEWLRRRKMPDPSDPLETDLFYAQFELDRPKKPGG